MYRLYTIWMGHNSATLVIKFVDNSLASAVQIPIFLSIGTIVIGLHVCEFKRKKETWTNRPKCEVFGTHFNLTCSLQYKSH